jgi:hypothetical protein
MATKRTLESEDIEQELALRVSVTIAVIHPVQNPMKILNSSSSSNSLNLGPVLAGTRTGDLHEEGTRTFTCSLDPPEALTRMRPPISTKIARLLVC